MRKHQKQILILVFVSLFFILLGCSQGKVDDDTGIPTLTVVDSTVTPVVTETPVPTMTAIVTQTSIVIPTVTSTVTSTAEKIVPEKYQEYIGKIDPVDVPDIAGPGGMLLSGLQSEPMYALAVAGINDDVLILFEKDITPYRTKNHEWEILDILVIPYGQIDGVFAVESCYKGDEWIRNVVGIIVVDDESYYNRWVTNEGILALWHINRELERFEVVSDITGYECSPESGFMIGPSSRTPMPENVP